MDHILISGLRARCILGVSEEERRERQEVCIDLVLGADLAPAARSDQFADALDYRALKKRVLNLVEQSHYHLLEALAAAIAELCLASSAVHSVRVRVDKPGALRFARTVGVEVTRRRPT